MDIESFDPDWGGASWYGTTSGTYWTLNPKEYADPRKHGPEYQARARRSGQRGEINDEVAPAQPGASASAGPDQSIGVDAAADATAPPAPTHTTSSWWEATTAEPSPTTGSAEHRARPWPGAPPERRSARAIEEPTGHSTDAVIAAIRGWLDDDRPTHVARIGRAAIGWAPIAIGASWLAGEISGCGRFAATCPSATAPLIWITQLGIFVLLVLLPRIARITSVAAIAILTTVFPASLLLFATGDPEGMAAGRAILGGLMIIAWIGGLAYGISREVRRESRPLS